MLNFVLWDTGAQSPVEPATSAAVSHPDQLMSPADGYEWITVTDINTRTLALIDGEVREVAIEMPIEVARGLKWEAAKFYREQRKSAGCMTPKGRIQTREEPTKNDRQTITGLYLGALGAKFAGWPYSAKITMENNEELPCGADDVIAIGNAMAAYIQACQDRGTAMRAQIFEAATTLEAIAAIDITAGYPAE